MEGVAILSLLVEHGALGEWEDRRGAWVLLQRISCCSRYMYEYIKHRMPKLKLSIMSEFIDEYNGAHDRVTVYRKNGDEQGLKRTFNNKHEFPDEETMKNGLKHGQQRLYHVHAPTIITTKTYCNGTERGQCCYYYLNGALANIWWEPFPWRSGFSHEITYRQDGTEMTNNWAEVEEYYRKKGDYQSPSKRQKKF
jgi:hypothetical protein